MKSPIYDCNPNRIATLLNVHAYDTICLLHEQEICPNDELPQYTDIGILEERKLYNANKLLAYMTKSKETSYQNVSPKSKAT